MNKSNGKAKNRNFVCRIDEDLQDQLDLIKKSVGGMSWSDEVRIFLANKVIEFRSKNAVEVNQQ